MSEHDILVPVSHTPTARATVDYAVEQAVGGEIHLVVCVSGITQLPEGSDEREHATHVIDQARAWANETKGDRNLDITTAILAEDEYVFGPDDYANQLGTYAEEHGLTHVVIDPGYWDDTVGPMFQAFEAAIERTGLVVEEAPVTRRAQHERLRGADPAVSKMVALFGVSLGFYLLLGDVFYWFDWVTGILVAGIVAITIGSVTFSRAPTFPGSVMRTIRFGVYIPYLMFEIIKANFVVAYVILHPQLPIEPQLVRVEAKVPGGLPLLALANSITLTPGTLAVRANDQRLVVHTLLPSARDGLFDGELERAVRFVFFGRDQVAIPTPRERGDVGVIDPVAEEVEE